MIMAIQETITLLCRGIIFPVSFLLRCIEYVLFVMILLYDSYCYSPLQSTLIPVVTKVPRSIQIGAVTWNVFTANIVSWSRTLLVVPIAICLKYDHTYIACGLVVLHDFLDHLDGIVAKTQKSIYGPLDDPLLGGYLDALCDKIVNCLCLWSILMVTDFTQMTSMQTCIFVGLCSTVIAYEFVIGVIRTQDYFLAYYLREFHDTTNTVQPKIAASMEGKLKEKLESVAIACLCLCQTSANPLLSISGCIGLTCLGLSIRLAHSSMMHKLHKLDIKPKEQDAACTQKSEEKQTNRGQEKSTFTRELHKRRNHTRRQSAYDDFSDENSSQENSDVYEKDDIVKDRIQATSNMSNTEGKNKKGLSRSMSVPSWAPLNQRVDKVYTVGCFDMFHEGHEILFQRLKMIGKQVIVGVHDSRSIFQLKNKVPIDSTSKRMANVKQHADIVFCIHGTSPGPYIFYIFDNTEGVTSLYVRGDDMMGFPGRDVTENLMPVHFLPYTPTVSSTKIRKEIYNASRFGPHVRHDDHIMFY